MTEHPAIWEVATVKDEDVAVVRKALALQRDRIAALVIDMPQEPAAKYLADAFAAESALDRLQARLEAAEAVMEDSFAAAAPERVNEDVAVVNCALNPLGMNHPARRALDRLQARLKSAEDALLKVGTPPWMEEWQELTAERDKARADADKWHDEYLAACKSLTKRVHQGADAVRERDKARADAERLAALIRHATLIHYDVERGEWLTYAVNKADADAALAAHEEQGE